MSKRTAPDAPALLDAWRASGADRLDPLRFHFIAALARRADLHSGAARRVLDGKLASWLSTYAADVKRAGLDGVAHAQVAAAAEAPGSTATPAAVPVEAVPPAGSLAALIAHIGSQDLIDGASPASQAIATRRAAYPEIPAIDYFRETWSKVSTNRQLRQSQEHVPDNAGPLNSSHLVHRSLSMMREVSPGYLRQFLSYVEALSWMEEMNGIGVAPGKDAPRAGGVRKGGRAKPR